MVSYVDTRLTVARAAIAATYLDALPPAALGTVLLRDDQCRIVARSRRLIRAHGGCLIGEDVGRGKTFVALALARDWTSPLVVIPSALRSTWQTAMERARVPCVVVSHDALSRGRVPVGSFDGVIVDESHHFRTMSTRRHATLCDLTAATPVVLLSATPVQNRMRDLAAQLAIFLGEIAFVLGPDALARHVVRGADTLAGVMPHVAPPAWITTEADDSSVLRAILDLAPPARPLDGGDAGALRAISLVRAWASSRAALRATLHGRRRLAAAIEQGIEAGRLPTRHEARAWHGEDDVVQLGFAPLLIHGVPDALALSDARSAFAAERKTMARLTTVLDGSPDPDRARVNALRKLRIAHPTSSILAFSEYASTVRAFYAALRTDAGTGMLTSRIALIASGPITRDDMFARFAPIAQHLDAHPCHERVTLLLATDLLSEGVNLQDARIVVHLDLPWNPARLAQRVGRVRRPGGAPEVLTFLLAPPAAAAVLLDAEARLRRKLATAERAIGADFEVLPALARIRPNTSPGCGDGMPLSATMEGQLVATLTRWKAQARVAACISGPGVVTAAVASPVRGWLAALDDGRLLASHGESVPDTDMSPFRIASRADGRALPLSSSEIDAALASAERFLATEAIAAACGLDIDITPLRRTILERLRIVSRSLPRHRRAELLPLAARLREALRAPLSLGAERALAQLAQARETDAGTWLSDAIRVAEAAAQCAQPRHARPARVVALIICRPDESGDTHACEPTRP